MMIEVFTKRRILAFLGFVVLVTGAGLLLNSHWEYNKQLAKQEEVIKNKARKSASCEMFSVISRCERCSKQESRDDVGVCSETGYKQRIKCDSGKEEFIWVNSQRRIKVHNEMFMGSTSREGLKFSPVSWCDISPAVEESDFWKFQLCTLLLGLSSYAVVYLRQKKLDKRLMEKINKQIAAGI
ncbi:hypothetical protein BsWGS_05195 [Bradybaena similaris]